MGDCQSLGDCGDERIARLYEYLDGALSVDDLKDVREHLEGCEECTHEYDLECIIRSVVKRSCQEVAPNTLKTRIMSRISELRVETRHD
ncbi:MAG: mycothiol system anti-sigma-R factor [Arthrobacter sp.]|uniref:mycothiol system anti-sigma-R factor n=1 Tax=unclassified Arthrobacter TaxID=235627 RepID=UPI00264CDBAB|nr:mycothiol system anti-sigma-R factor [Micrococcaceae bacterium]MDN5812497.1 mycothiol system anti-sigma-R factor [Micrococcaceae bacterium]MDN5823260.1 mycothiol system anti-sigma-R factor [Micrococcaceae bacterium]MDN5879858.1 mycothiol system anti-sigma-R factor [Micrococcaceae bacterium]MDN5887264.1 mycothiol system anti-sigma-R factor [Micrococcaceae bacterium]